MKVRKRQQVVQVIVREQGRGDKLLMGKRKKDDYWEFLGGKLEENEDILDAGIRELSEETGVSVSMDDVVEHHTGESYRSKDNGKYVLNPLKLTFRKNTFSDLQLSDMPDHSDYAWIDITDFYKYETLGQYQALRNVGLINGDVAMAIPFNGEKYLLAKRSESSTSSGFWAFPGGKVKDVEDARAAALRQLEEETNLTGEIQQEAEPYIDEGQLGYWRILPFLVKVQGEVSLDGEHSDYEWVNLEDIGEKETLGERKALEKLNLK